MGVEEGGGRSEEEDVFLLWEMGQGGRRLEGLEGGGGGGVGLLFLEVLPMPRKEG
jgi:hypothetical protein